MTLIIMSFLHHDIVLRCHYDTTKPSFLSIPGRFRRVRRKGKTYYMRLTQSNSKKRLMMSNRNFIVIVLCTDCHRIVKQVCYYLGVSLIISVKVF